MIVDVLEVETDWQSFKVSGSEVGPSQLQMGKEEADLRGSSGGR